MNNLVSWCRKIYMHMTGAISFIAILLIVLVGEDRLVNDWIGGVSLAIILIHFCLSLFVMAAFKYRAFTRINGVLSTALICMVATIITIVAGSPMNVGVVSIAYMSFLTLGILINLIQK